MKKVGMWLLFGITVLLALAGIGFVIYVYVRYGNTPITELPAWVLPFFTN